MSKHLLIKACIIAGFILLSNASYATDLQSRQHELKQVQRQISQQQNTLKSTSKQRARLLTLLKQDEQAIAKVAQKASEIQGEIKKIDKELNELVERQQELNKLKKIQQDTLSTQLVSAYMTGKHDYTKMLLNQQNPSQMERMLAYYQYLNKARMQAIENLKLTLTELTQLSQQERERKTQLNALMINQQQETKQLKIEQQQRQKTLSQLQRTLNNKGAELEQLQIEEANLKRMLDEAAKQKIINAQSMSGLSKLAGKISWPTQGQIRHKFGEVRSKGITWKGVILAAPEGQDIRVIAPGKVIYADWLKGFGMVMVVDHGKGYMSLYGHAQTLLKPVGSSVKTGDVIALVGRSGGQSQSGLYFEIRHKGYAINPAKYCR